MLEAAWLTWRSNNSPLQQIKCYVESVYPYANVYSECHINRGLTWHRLHCRIIAGKQTLSTQRRQASSKITVWLVCFQDNSASILPEPQRILRLTHSSCFSALTADNINCQLLRMCNGMHTVPLRIYAPVSLKSCCNLRNCLAFCGLIACLLHCGIVQLLKGGLKACVLK